MVFHRTLLLLGEFSGWTSWCRFGMSEKPTPCWLRFFSAQTEPYKGVTSSKKRGIKHRNAFSYNIKEDEKEMTECGWCGRSLAFSSQH